MNGEGAETDQTCQKWFVKLHAGDFSLDDGQVDQLNLIAVKWRHQLRTSNDSQPTQNIQINKVIGENEKCACFMEKKYTDFLANPIETFTCYIF